MQIFFLNHSVVFKNLYHFRRCNHNGLFGEMFQITGNEIGTQFGWICNPALLEYKDLQSDTTKNTIDRFMCRDGACTVFTIPSDMTNVIPVNGGGFYGYFYYNVAVLVKLCIFALENNSNQHKNDNEEGTTAAKTGIGENAA